MIRSQKTGLTRWTSPARTAGGFALLGIKRCKLNHKTAL